MEGPPLGPGGEDITWPDQVAPRGRKASSTRKIKPQTSNPKRGRRQTEETAATPPPRSGRRTRDEGAPRLRQAPPVNRPHAPTLPAANGRRTGGAQDGANGAAPSEAGLRKAGAPTRAGGFPPPPPPPRH